MRAADKPAMVYMQQGSAERAFDKQAARETSATASAKRPWYERDARANDAARAYIAQNRRDRGFAVDVASAPHMRGPVAMALLLGLGVSTLGFTMRSKIRGRIEETDIQRQHNAPPNDPNSPTAPGSRGHPNMHKHNMPVLIVGSVAGMLAMVAAASAYYAPQRFRKQLLVASNSLLVLGAAFLMMGAAHYANGVSMSYTGIADQFAYTTVIQALSVYALYDTVRA